MFMVLSLARAKNNNIGQNKLTGNSSEVSFRIDFRKQKIMLFWKGATSVQIFGLFSTPVWEHVGIPSFFFFENHKNL